MLKYFKVLLFSLLLIFIGSCSSEPIEYSDVQIDTMLFALKPLPKVHYSWPLSGELLSDRESRRLYELARINHSVCISGEWTNPEQVDNCVYTCARLNKTNPAIKASIGVNFSPWHRKFGKDLPPMDRGQSYFEEIKYFNERAKLVKGWIGKSNQIYESKIQVTAVMLDCERFGRKSGNSEWNEAVREALDTIHLAAKAVFPEADIIWYGRGMIQHPRLNTWRETPYWTGLEIKAPLTCSIYNVPEIQRMRDVFQKTCELADEMKIDDVIPYVALASGYRRNIKGHSWESDWKYDIKHSFNIGAELNITDTSISNKLLPPYHRARFIIFYPRPFDSRVPNWGKHFIAYVRGATGESFLTDIQGIESKGSEN